MYFHGRYMNLPVQLIVPLHSNLKQDLDWIISQSSSLSFTSLQYVLLLTSCSSETAMKKGTCLNITGSSSIMMNNFEDDIFAAHSICTIQIQFSSSPSPSPVCLILLPIDKLERCYEEIRQLVPA